MSEEERKKYPWFLKTGPIEHTGRYQMSRYARVDKTSDDMDILAEYIVKNRYKMNL